MGYEEIYEDFRKQEKEIQGATGGIAEQQRKIQEAREQALSEEERLKKERLRVEPAEQLIIAKKIEDIQREKKRFLTGGKELAKTEGEIKTAQEQLAEQLANIQKYEKEGYQVERTPEGQLKFTKQVQTTTPVTRVVSKPSTIDYSAISSQVASLEAQKSSIVAKRDSAKKALDTLKKLVSRLPPPLRGKAPQNKTITIMQNAVSNYVSQINAINNQINVLKSATPSGATEQIQRYETATKTIEKFEKRTSFLPDKLKQIAQTSKVFETLKGIQERAKPTLETYMVASGITKTAFEQYGTINIPDYNEGGVTYRGKTFSKNRDKYEDIVKYFQQRSESIARQEYMKENPYQTWKEDIRVPDSLVGIIPEDTFKRSFYKYAVTGEWNEGQFRDWTTGQVEKSRIAEQEKIAEKERAEERRLEEAGVSRIPVKPITKSYTSLFEGTETGVPLVEEKTGDIFGISSPIYSIRFGQALTAKPEDLPWTPEGAKKIQTEGGLTPFDYEKFEDIRVRELKKATDTKAVLGWLTGGVVPGDLETGEQKLHYIGTFEVDGKMQRISLPETQYHYWDNIIPSNTKYSELRGEVAKNLNDLTGGLNTIDENINKIKDSPYRKWSIDIDPKKPGLEEVSSKEALDYLNRQKQEYLKTQKHLVNQLKAMDTLNSLGYAVLESEKGGWTWNIADPEEVFNKSFGQTAPQIFGAESFWGGLFGLETAAQKVASEVTGDPSYWKAKEGEIYERALQQRYLMKRTQKAGGQAWFPALAGTIASPTGQDIALIVGTFGLGKAVKGGITAYRTFKGGATIGKIATHIPTFWKNVAVTTGKVLGTTMKVGKYTIRPIATPLLVGGIVGLEVIQLAKTYEEAPELFPGRATRQLGLSLASIYSFRKGFGKLPPKIVKPRVETPYKPTLIGKAFKETRLLAKEAYTGAKEYMWAFHPEITGKIAKTTGRVADVFKGIGYKVTAPPFAGLPTIERKIAQLPVRTVSALKGLKEPVRKLTGKIVTRGELAVIKGRAQDFLTFKKVQLGVAREQATALKTAIKTKAKAVTGIIGKKLVYAKALTGLKVRKGVDITRTTLREIKYTGMDIFKRKIYKPLEGKLSLEFKPFLQPEKEFVTHGIKFEELGIIQPPKSTLATTGKKIISGLRRIGYSAKVFPKTKARQLREFFDFRTTFGKAKFVAKHEVKLLKHWKGVFEPSELKAPYETYRRVTSTHPLFPERRLWYAEKKVVERVAQRPFAFRVGEKEEVMVVSYGGIKTKTYRGIPGRMQLVKTEIEPFVAKAVGKPAEKSIWKTYKTILPEEQVTEVTGTFIYKRGGFTKVQPFYAQIGATPSSLEKPFEFFPDLAKGEVYDLSGTKIFDVRSATYSGAKWQKSYGLSRITAIKRLPGVSVIESKGFIEPSASARLLGLKSEPAYQSKGLFVDLGQVKGISERFGKIVKVGFDVDKTVSGITEAISEQAQKIIPTTQYVSRAPSLGFYKPGGAKLVGITKDVAEAGFTTVGGIKASYTSAYAPVGLNKILAMEEGIITTPHKIFGISSPIQLSPVTDVKGIVKQEIIQEVKPRSELKEFEVVIQQKKITGKLFPIVTGELGTGVITDIGRKNVWDTKFLPIQKVGTKLALATRQALKQRTALKQRLALATGVITMPSLAFEPTPVSMTETVTGDIVQTIKPIIPSVVLPHKPQSVMEPEVKEEMKMTLKRRTPSPVDDLKIKVLASPFLVMRSQIKFGKATHPKTTEKLFKKGILTGFKIPTVELVEELKGKRKARRTKFDWRLGENVKLTL